MRDRHTIHVLHDEIRIVALGGAPDATVVDRDDIRTRKTGRCPRLFGEAFREVRLFGKMRVHELDSDVALEAVIAGTIHRGHTAPGNA